MYARCDILIGMNKRPQVDLGAQLRQAIRQSGLTRYELAKRSDVQYSALWRFLANPDNDPHLSTANKLITALGLRVELKPARQHKRK